MDSSLQRERPEATTTRDVVLIILVALILFVPSFFTRDLWNPDEPRYMEVAREMIALKSFIIPHLNGEVYSEKPPMFFWLTAGVYSVTGTFTAGRIVDLLSTLGTLLLIYFFGRKLLSPGGGLLAALIMASTLLYLGIARSGVIDALLVFLTTGAIISAYHALHGTQPRAKRWWLLFYALSGLAVLTKGPVGLLPGGIFVLVYALFNRKKVTAGGWMHLLGALILAAVLAGWLVPAAFAGGREYMDTILFKQNLGRAVNSYSHKHDPAYYLYQLPYYLFPWSFFFGLGLVQFFRDWARKKDRDAMFMALWFVVILVFFSVASGKRERYILPALPGMALVCARYFTLGRREGLPWPTLHRWFAGVTFALVGIVGVVFAAMPFMAKGMVAKFAKGDQELAAYTQERLAAALTPAIIVVTLALAATLIALAVMGAVWAVKRARVSATVALLLAAIGAISLFADFVVFPKLNDSKSSRQFGEQALRFMNRADKSFLFNHKFSGVINLYTGITRIPVIASDESLSGDEKTEDVDRRLAEELREDASVVVISDERQIGRAAPILPRETWLLVRERVGHRRMALISNRRWGEDARLVGDILTPSGK